jgi:formate hydrogenlyase transcriptional activator
VRELENFIERAVILSPGADLHVPLSDLKPLTGNSTNGAKTLEGMSASMILKILRQTNWIIGGPGGGAAMQLGMQRSTLQSWMKKLGIARPSRADISAPSR